MTKKKTLAKQDSAIAVKNLSEEEVWLSIKKQGAHDSIQIIEQTTPDQLQYILDIELWKKDKFLPENMLEWLGLLSECGDQKILQWVHEADLDSVILAFKKFLTVHKKENQEDDPLDRDWPNEFPPVTADGIFYFQAISQEADQIVRPILMTLAKNDHVFFSRMCDAIMTEISSSLEEAAFSWRSRRLAEKGFAPIEEALSVYAYINERGLSSLPTRANYKKDELPKVALYPLANSGEQYPLFMMALSHIKDRAFYDEVMLELATLANKVVMADGRPIMPETIEASLKKVMGYVNIGLEKLSGANPDKAGDVLKERYLMHLFQVGYSLVARLRQQVRKFRTMDWPKDIDGDLSLLGEHVALIIDGVDRKKPRYFTAGDPENPYREFRSIDDVRRVENIVEYADYLGRMFATVFGLDVAKIKGVAEEWENVCFENAFLTIWAKHIVAGSYKFAPLTEKELKIVIKKTFKDDQLKQNICEKTVADLLSKQPTIDPEEEKFCKQFVERSLEKFENEFSELSEKGDIDWRYVQSIWVIPEAD